MQESRLDSALIRRARAARFRPRMDGVANHLICARVKKARVEAGLTQEEMGRLLDVTTRTYQHYEADRVPFRLLDRIASLTGVTQEWLLRGEESREIQIEESLEELLEAARSISEAIAVLQEGQREFFGLWKDQLESFGGWTGETGALLERLDAHLNSLGAPRTQGGGRKSQ